MPRMEEKEKKVPSFVMMNKNWCFCFTCDERKAKKHGSFLIPVEGKKKFQSERNIINQDGMGQNINLLACTNQQMERLKI